MIVAPSILQKAIDTALSSGADFADIFVEESWSRSIGVLDSKPQRAVVGELYGAGVRLFFGHEIIYVTTNDLSEAGLVKAARQAAQSRSGQGPRRPGSPLQTHSFDSIHLYGAKPWETDLNEKIKWLMQIDQAARRFHSSVTQVEPNLNEKWQKVQIANSQGLHVSDERAYSRLALSVNVNHDGVKEGFHDIHSTMGTAETFAGLDRVKFAEEVAGKAILLATAKFAPAAEMPVVIDHGFGGVIFHEACGHGLETTSVAKNASVFAGKMGQKIAHESVTAIDDGTIRNGWGSLNVDDEGRATQKTTLIENGILKSYMVDEMGSRQTGHAATGSGRRQSYKFAPASRMRNTYIAAGSHSLEEMIRDVDYGLYAKKMGGGSVTPSTGDYNFAVSEAYIIRNGRIEEPVKGATLIGRGIETLGKIIKVGHDLKLSEGMCGSISGSIPAALGQPPILVSSLLVGGRASK